MHLGQLAHSVKSGDFDIDFFWRMMFKNQIRL